MPGVAHIASLRLVLEREDSKKKKRAQYTPFEKCILDMVESGKADIEQHRNERNEANERRWLRTELLRSDLVAPEPGASILTRWMHAYNEAAFVVNERIVKTIWFDLVIMLTIAAVGIGIGLGLSGVEEKSDTVTLVNETLDQITFIVFFFEAVLKIFSCGSRPWVYFMSEKDGNFNTFDFVIVVISTIYSPYFGGSASASNIKVLRLARLCRLFDFVEQVPEVRVMVKGLASAIDSVWYILLLLVLLVYVYAVVGVILFAENDPANFNDVASAMLTLFQVSTFTNWSSVALLSFHGCDKYVGNGYVNGLEEPLPSGKARSSSTMGNFNFATWNCVSPNPQRWGTFFFFTTFVILAGLVILSLFIGVITIGMFTEYNKYAEEKDVHSYNEGVDLITQAFANPESTMRMAVDFAMGIENPNVAEKLQVRETHEGIVFEVRTKNHDGKFPSQRIVNKNALKGDFKSPDSSIDSEEQLSEAIENETPLPAEVSVWSRLRPVIFSKLSDKNLKSSRGNFLAKVKAQNALLRKSVFVSVKDLSPFGRMMDAMKKMSQKLADSHLFQNFITLTVLIAAFTVGVETDKRGDPRVNEAIDFICLFIFTFECFVKICACGERPQKYFEDKWNQFDLLIVLNGWANIMDIVSIEFLVVFRLLYLLRVLRVARAFPRLRSIVNALIEALGAVKWMVILMCIFNYIAACCGMILFSKHDPFYFGGLLQSFLTIFIISTLDLWDVVMRINLYGCDVYPSQSGYPLSPDYPCESPKAFGYFGALFVGMVVVFGGMILPTMFIGVISIKFEQSTERFSNEVADRLELASHIAILQDDVEVSEFFDSEKIEVIDGIFKLMDIDGQGRLDLNEVGPFVKYLISVFLGYDDVHGDEVENVVLFFDENNTGDLNFAEFLSCIRYLLKARLNPIKWNAPRSELQSSTNMVRITKLGFDSLDDLLNALESGKSVQPSGSRTPTSSKKSSRSLKKKVSRVPSEPALADVVDV